MRRIKRGHRAARAAIFPSRAGVRKRVGRRGGALAPRPSPARTFASSEGPEEGAVLADDVVVDVAQQLARVLAALGRQALGGALLLLDRLPLGLGRLRQAGAAQALGERALLGQRVDPALRAAPALAARDLDAAAHLAAASRGRPRRCEPAATTARGQSATTAGGRPLHSAA